MDYILEIHDILPKEVCESIIERYKKDPKKEAIIKAINVVDIKDFNKIKK